MATFQTLTTYLASLRRVLHDANASYWSDTDLTAFLNSALGQRDRDTWQNRAIVTFSLTAGTSTYALSTVNANAFDVLNIIVIWGNFRIPLKQAAYSELGSVYQPYTGYQQTPVVFSRYGSGKIILAPIPDQAYSSEWDVVLSGPALVNPGDADPLPDPWSDPVPYLAAYFAKLEIQQYEEANQFLKIYQDRMRQVLDSARGYFREVPYGGGEMRWR